MTDGDQERFEDYLELETYIEALQAGKTAHPPANLTLEQARIYQMATLFRSATDENTQLRAEFVEQLKAQLLALSEQQQSQPVAPPTLEPTLLSTESAKGKPKYARFFSRRGLLTGGAAAAASLVVGTGIGYEEHARESPPADNPATSYSTDTPPKLTYAKNIPTTWHFVTTLADLGDGAVRFTSPTIVGYVIRNTYRSYIDKHTTTITALSAACTHMGCLLQWQSSARSFSCPCHGALFSADGTQLPTDYKYALPPLPGLNTKIEDGKIYVEVPL